MKKIVTISAFALLACGVVAARAGYRYPNYAVTVDYANRIVGGQLGGARATGDNTQFIGCQIEGWDHSVYPSGFRKVVCQAQDANGNYAVCYTAISSTWQNTFVEVLQTAKSDGYLVFTWDANGNCQYIRDENYSWHAPRVW